MPRILLTGRDNASSGNHLFPTIKHVATKKRTTLTPADFVQVAIKYVDAHGLDALTMRALGEEMHVDATALYRHFPNKQSLINAMVEWFLNEVLNKLDNSLSKPRDVIMDMALVARSTFRIHPEIGTALTRSSGGDEAGRRTMVFGMNALQRLGIGDDQVVHCYQAFESLVLGACVFDFSGAPHHEEVRRVRYRSLEMPAFDLAGTNVKTVADISDKAFVLAVDALIDRFVAMAASR